MSIICNKITYLGMILFVFARYQFSDSLIILKYYSAFSGGETCEVFEDTWKCIKLSVNITAF
jgi:hypothetical protein